MTTNGQPAPLNLRAAFGPRPASALRRTLARAGLSRVFSVTAAAVLVSAVLLLHRGRLAAAAFLLWSLSLAHAQVGPTVIHVEGAVLHQGVKRFGINMGGQDFYDSRQMLRNLVSRNPGFEGEQWQSVLQCRFATPGSCTDVANGAAWPEGFLDGGTYEVIAGRAQGQTGTILHSTVATQLAGVTVLFAPGSKSPAPGDIFVVRKSMPGDAAAGWWTSVAGGASVATEFHDLSPATAGRQALRVNASAPGQSASVSSFFDSTTGHTFVRMSGPYMVRFRAKSTGGNRTLAVALRRAAGQPLLSQTLTLTPSWQDYSLPFHAAEGAGLLGTAALSFVVSGGNVLLDDVSLAPATSNGTVFRDEVVATLQTLRPGVLRDMDSGQNFGSSFDNMLAVPGARLRPGYNKYAAKSEEIPIGLHDFLVLAEKIGAEPWYTMPLGMTEQEARDLFEYLGGPIDTKYGARRAALGHPTPWTQTFPLLHIEYGNEAWNYAQQGACIPDPALYSVRASAIFRAMRSSPWFSAPRFDLIADGQAVNLSLNQEIVNAASGFDTIDIAPYLFTTFSDAGSTERIFGPMLAQPQMYDTAPHGVMYQQSQIAANARHPVHLAVYESGMNTSNGTVDQQNIQAAIPSLGAGLTAVEHMLLMMRDMGVTVQNTFHLAGYQAPFANPTIPGMTSPIWGIVLDMGGATNRVRPSFLAQQMVNEAIRPTMLATTLTGADPVWNQALSANDQIQLRGAHEMQSFAFSDGVTDTLIVFNLSRTATHAIQLSGKNAPRGTVAVETLTSAHITDSNETGDTVQIRKQTVTNVVHDHTAIALGPFSMTVLTSEHTR